MEFGYFSLEFDCVFNRAETHAANVMTFLTVPTAVTCVTKTFGVSLAGREVLGKTPFGRPVTVTW